MIDIAKIDKNFFVSSTIDEESVKFYSVKDGEVEVKGVLYENECFRRMPESVATSVSDGVKMLHNHTSGGRVRFKTDSSFVVISAKFTNITKAPHMTLANSCGFDMYVDNSYYNSFLPDFGVGPEGFTSHTWLGKGIHEVTINFPTYSGVTDLYIGLHKESAVEKATPYNVDKPIVYYGSSITQGACASRPGMAYPAIISRQLNADFINLGFSGSCKAEQNICDYIKTLDMSLLVYEYDYNADNPEKLKETHEPFFRQIREKYPDLPVVMVSAPRINLANGFAERREIVLNTYENAVNAGDKNVYFVDGYGIFDGNTDVTVEGTHPTDLGFYTMAQKIGEAIEKALG